MTQITKQYRNFGADLLSELHDMRANLKSESKGAAPSSSPVDKAGSRSFMDHIKDGLEEVNTVQKTADKMATDLASGKSENLHETMLAATHAELSFNLMVALRNKALEAYQEVMRMQV